MGHCPECGATLANVEVCVEHFYQMLAWESEHPHILAVHHLMVLSYYLQHPSLYSPEGLAHAKGLLVDFLERGMSTEEVRRRDRVVVDSGKRQFKIKGTPGHQGAYTGRVPWTLTAADVTAGGVEGYCERARAWAGSILVALRASGNLETP